MGVEQFSRGGGVNEREKPEPLSNVTFVVFYRGDKEEEEGGGEAVSWCLVTVDL